MTQRKGGDSCDSSDLQRYLQDLELKGIFSTGLGKVIDESRSKNLRAPSSCIPVLHVALTALSKSESRRKDSQQDEQVHEGEMVLPPTLLAEVRNKRPHWALRNSLIKEDQLGWKRIFWKCFGA